MSEVRKRPPLLRALGSDDPPERVSVGGRPYDRVLIYKHDSWAATALYEGADGTRIVCKFNRQQPLLVVPMKWLGRWLGQREARFLRQLADLDAVPDDLGEVVVDGRVADHAVARAFVEGAPLFKGQRVDDEFFARLSAAIGTLHERGIVYNDLHKKENVIVGTDGRPYLVDFQVSLGFGEGRFGRSGLGRWMRSELAAFDRYHVGKHVAHCRPDTLTADELEQSRMPPKLLQLHRKVARPLRRARRRLLVALGVRSGAGQAASEAEPEDAVQRELGRSGPKDG